MFNKAKRTGFTLIEMLITVSIIGILAAVVYPSYTSFIMRSDRAEAFRELVRIANLQEQYFADTRTYASDLTNLGLASSPYTTENGNYSIASSVSGDTFKLTATAKGKQAKDTGCTVLTIDEAGTKGPTSAIECWEQ